MEQACPPIAPRTPPSKSTWVTLSPTLSPAPEPRSTPSAPETTAFVVSAAAGLDVTCEAVPYIASFGGEEALERSAQAIDAIARRIEDALELRSAEERPGGGVGVSGASAGAAGTACLLPTVAGGALALQGPAGL